MAETVIVTLVVAIIVIAILYIISIWIYKRTPSNMGFIRTGHSRLNRQPSQPKGGTTQWREISRF